MILFFKKSILVLFLLSYSTSSVLMAQKIKILLVGTIHFETPHKDKFELDVDNFLSSKRQTELQKLTLLLANTKAQKVMIEISIEDQLFHDSLYHKYLNNLYTLTISEREQIGFRLAKQLNLKHIYCVDELYGNPHDSVMGASAIEYNQTYLLDSLRKEAGKMLLKFNEITQSNTITNILLQINKKEFLKKNLELYLKYIAQVGAGKNYAGAESVSDWYLRNLAIYSNIISLTEPKDKYIIVLFGQGHIPLLKHFFENNSDYEVIDLENVLRR